MFDMREHIHQSNLIENIDSRRANRQSLKAWEWLIKQPHLNEKTILELHRLITKDQLNPIDSGHWRRVNVFVGDYYCPDPDTARRQVYVWIYKMLHDGRTLDPIVMHIEFEKIHPFIDGNGRTGRMLMWCHQKKQGLEPLLVDFNNRKEYYGWFR